MRSSGSERVTARPTAGLEVGLLFGATVLAVGWLLPSSIAQSNAILACAALTGLLVTVIIVRYRHTGDLLDPLVLFSATFVWYYGVHTLWVTTHGETLRRALVYPYEQGLAPGLGLMVLGYLALLGGFAALPTARTSAQSVRTWYSKRALVLVFAFGMLMQIAGAAAGAYKKGQNPTDVVSGVLTFRVLAFVATIALAVCCVQHYTLQRRQTTYRWLMWGMLAIQVIFALAVAQKALAFTAVLAWIVARNYAHTPLRVRQVLVVALVAVFVVTPIVQSSRNAESVSAIGDQSDLTSVQATSSTIPQRLTTFITTLPDSALTGFDILNARTNGAESLALAYLYTPGYSDYQYGRRWPGTVTSLIPRFVWPNKPIYNPTRDFSQVYGGQSAVRGYGLTLALTLPGDFYLNFGWVGLIGGMMAVGLVLKLVVNALRRFEPTVAVCLYLAAMLSLLIIEQDLTSIGSALLLNLLGVWLALRLLAVAGKSWAPVPPSALHPAETR